MNTQPIVLITGASSGIGQAMAAHYYQAGWRVALVARRLADMQDWAKSQNWEASRYRAIEADVADIGQHAAGQISSMGQAAQVCMHELGLPDVVIANAGISIGVDSGEASDLDVFQRILAVNNVGLLATFQPFITPMKTRGSGKLVGIASVAAIRGLPFHAGYCASKAAVVAQCESLRGELRGSGVEVLTILPGYVRTPLTEKNRYPMPFLIDADRFAALAFASVEKGNAYKVIPWQMGIVAKLLRALPNAWFDKIFAGRPRKQRSHEL